MRKTIEIEYVGVEDLQEILDDICAVIKEGHHVYFDTMSVERYIYTNVYIMIGGFKVDREFDFKFSFKMSDDKEDVKIMNECKVVLKNLLVED